jgi:hypothetical protein
VGAHPVGGAVDADDDAAVQEAVQGGGGEHGVAEPFGPGGDADVGCGDDAAFEVAGVDDLEEQGPGFLVQDPVAELVQLCGYPHRSTYAEPVTMPRALIVRAGQGSRRRTSTAGSCCRYTRAPSSPKTPSSR